MDVIISINISNGTKFSEQVSPLCVEFPLKLLNAISGIIYINGIFGFLSNLLIFICYSLFKTGKKLSTTECFIAFLSLADMTFSVSVLFIGISGHMLSEQALQSCYFYKFTAILHAFEQFLSWLLFLGITVERFISICKPVLHRAIFTEKRVHYVSGTMVLVAACLAAPLVMSDCENEYDYMFGYYLTVRTFLAMTNISCMTITYYKISKRLQKLHLKRVMSMNAAAASKMRDALASKGTNEMPESQANRASAGSIGETVEESDSGRPGSCRKKKQVKIQVKAPFRKQRTRGSSSAGCSTRNSQDNSCNKTISSNLEFYRNLPGYMRERTRRKQEKKMAVVMFCATIAFLILVCPQCVANIVEFCLKEEWTVTQRNCFFWTDAISVCLFNLHFSVNFFIYSIVNSSFRKRLRCIIRCQLRERDSDFEGKMVNVSGSGGSDEQKHRKASIAKNKSALAMVELRRSPAQPPPKRVEVEINNPPSTSSVFPEGLDKTRLDIAHNSKC